MVKKVQSTEIALLGTQDVPKMLKDINAMIKAVKSDSPVVKLTTKEIPGYGTISSLTTLDTIIKATSTVIGKRDSFIAATKLVVPKNIKTPKFKLNDMTAIEMLDHLKLRAIEVANKEMLDKYEKIKITLESNLSREAKLANDLKNIQAMMLDED